MILKKKKVDIDFSSLLTDNKFYLISFIFYIAGLLGGTLIYKNLEASAIENATNLISDISTEDFLHMFLIKTLISIILLTICMFLGMSLIGYLVVNFVPLLYGFEMGVKLSYYYTSYNEKGIGYSLLLIIPQTVALIVVIMMSTKPIGELSKKIFGIVFKNADYEDNITIGDFCKSMVIIYISAIIVSAVSSLSIYLMNPLITLT